MDIQSIKSFVKVANIGSFTKAAEEMNYAQSTVTAQIQKLEEELGFPLFERIGQKNYLTAGGKEFLSHAAEILHIIQKSENLGHKLKDIKGSLRIGVMESLLFVGVLPILPQLRIEFPNVDVLLKIGQASELITLLRQNQLDIIYISNSANSDPNFHCCYKRSEEMAFIAAADHPLAKRRKIPVKELWQYPFVLAEQTGRCYGRLQEIAMEYELTLNSSVLIDNIVAIAALLHDGQSITFLPEYSLINEIEKGELIKIDVDIASQTYYSQLIYHKNKWIAPYMESFIKLISDIRPESK